MPTTVSSYFNHPNILAVYLVSLYQPFSIGFCHWGWWILLPQLGGIPTGQTDEIPGACDMSLGGFGKAGMVGEKNQWIWIDMGRTQPLTYLRDV